MQKFILQKTFERVTSLSTELMEFRSFIEAFNMWVELEGQAELNLNKNLEVYWDRLEGCLSRPALMMSEQLWHPIKFAKGISLTKWLSELHLPFQVSPKWIEQNFKLPDDFQTIPIWQITDNSYWSDLLFGLDTWANLVDTSLNQVEWMTDQTNAVIIMSWDGLFDAVETFEITTISDKFWFVSVQANLPNHLNETAKKLFLIIQLVARRAGNNITPTIINCNQLMIKLVIPRSDTSAHPPKSLITNGTLNKVIEYILVQLSSKYVIASHQLETALSEEIDRLKPYEAKHIIEQSWINRLQNIANNLSEIREAMSTLEILDLEAFNTSLDDIFINP